MIKAFIVKVDTGESTDFVSIAEDIQDALEGVMPVQSVEPWASPLDTVKASAAFGPPPPISPPTL